MKARYIDIDGKKVRIEFNWNAVITFLDECDIDLNTFLKLAETNNITPRHIRQLAWVAATEGERVEGRELSMGEIEFGSKLYPMQMTEIMQIFTEQFAGVAREEKKKGKPPRILFRIFR